MLLQPRIELHDFGTQTKVQNHVAKLDENVSIAGEAPDGVVGAAENCGGGGACGCWGILHTVGPLIVVGVRNNCWVLGVYLLGL